MRLLILLTFICSIATAQTQINGSRIKDGTVTQPKLSADALRPTDEGALSSSELIFGPEYRKKYTLTVSTNTTLSLSASTQTADSWIIIKAAGNGTNNLLFPSDWRMRAGSATYNPDANQTIELYYDGTDVFYEIIQGADIITAALIVAENVAITPNQINLTFNAAVNITTVGWTVDSDGDPVNASSVTASGTTSPIFTLDRVIEPGEVVTISYNPTVGNTTSLSGTELASITNFSVIVPPEVPDVPPPVCDCDFDVDTEGELTTAAATATTGQVVCIRAGTYRITVTPTNNGVTYQAYCGDTPIISGLNTISDAGWTVHSGSTYKKTVALPNNGTFGADITSSTTIIANQIFDGGEMQIQARWPNAATKEDMFDMYDFRHQAGGTNLVTGSQGTGFQPTSITDTNIGTLGGLGNLTGGSVFITGWFASGARTISSHSGNTINFPAYANNEGINVNFRKWWFVTNKLFLLDIAREWHYEGGILYLHAGGGSPTGIEYKARNWGFDLRNKTDITIKGITFTGCEVNGNTETHRVTLEAIKGYYTNHVFSANYADVAGFAIRKHMEQTGFRLLGSNNRVINSEFDFGASNCIWLGNNGIATNNLIKNYGYEGNYGAGVSFPGNTSGQQVERNTFDGFGRSCIDFSMSWYGYNQNFKIRYNDFKGFCKINQDGGAVYTGRGTNTSGGEIAYNWFHDDGAKADPQGIRVEGILSALYMDQGTGPILVHHNVFYDLWLVQPSGADNLGQDRSDAYIMSTYGNRTTNTASYWYNNTFANVYAGPKGWSYITYLVTPQDIQKNNIYRDMIIVNWGGDATTGRPPGGTTLVSNSVLQSTDPAFLGTGSEGLAYRLASGSLARNAGVHIPGITDNDPTTPDAGAYPFAENADPWIPGYDPDAVTGTNTIEDNNLSATTYSVTPGIINNGIFSGGTASYINTTNSTVTIQMSGTSFEWWGEKFTSHGIIEVKIDGVRQDCDNVTGGTQDCDCYQNTTTNNSQLIFSKTGMTAGAHTIVLKVTGTKNAASTNYFLVHDKITTP